MALEEGLISMGFSNGLNSFEKGQAASGVVRETRVSCLEENLYSS